MWVTGFDTSLFLFRGDACAIGELEDQVGQHMLLRDGAPPDLRYFWYRQEGEQQRLQECDLPSCLRVLAAFDGQRLDPAGEDEGSGLPILSAPDGAEEGRQDPSHRESASPGVPGDHIKPVQVNYLHARARVPPLEEQLQAHAWELLVWGRAVFRCSPRFSEVEPLLSPQDPGERERLLHYLARFRSSRVGDHRTDDGAINSLLTLRSTSLDRGE
jgi:hypothetical protein